VADNQFVHTGDLLLVIDPLEDRSQDAAMQQAEQKVARRRKLSGSWSFDRPRSTAQFSWPRCNGKPKHLERS
jgi:multidrug efflux pump subunit AcrA (membrane-fusion protein)